MLLLTQSRHTDSRENERNSAKRGVTVTGLIVRGFNMDSETGLGEVTQSVPVEQKMLSQEEVNRLIGREKAQAAEQAERRIRAELQTQTAAPTVDKGVLYDEFKTKLFEEINEEARQEYEKQQQESHVRTKHEIESKLRESSKEYEDFDKVVTGFNGNAYRDVLTAANQLPNTGDIVYELAKNPHKAAELQLLVNLNDTGAFNRKLKELSDSLVQNKTAVQNHKKVNQPLSHLKPSTVGADSGKETFSDLKKRYTN